MVRSEPRGVEETTPTLTFGQMATLRGYASKLRKLRDPMREHSTEYVINMWKVYNHLHLGGRNSAQILNLLTYVAYVYFLTYLLAHLPPPATMLRHAEAVSDLLLGEEFDQQTTHIYKSWYDVMTEQEMWEWAYGPLAAAVGGTHGKVDALMGTNWLLGPVRIRQERSEETNRTDCMEALEGVFGARVTEQLHKRGVECTSNWANGANRADFLDFSQPRSSLGLCSDACAADAGCESIVDCAEWNGDEDGCIKAIGCAFRKRSFVQAFPNWWQQQQTGNCPASSADSEGRCKGAHCCSLRRCYKDRDDQEQAIGGVHDEKDIGKEHACSMRRSAANLTWNPSGSYRSHVRMDSTTSESLWGLMQHVGDGGYHIDLPGDSETLIMMLKGLQQLGFVDQLTRSVDFQLILINGNRFSVPDRTMVSTTMEHASKYHPIVMVNVELNFMFSPSGFLSKYDRINAIQLRPLQFIYVEDENNKSFVTLLKAAIVLVPLWMMVQEFGELNEVGFTRWVSSGWNLFEAAYIVSIWLCLMSAWLYLAEEKTFLGHYNNSGSDNDTELLFNDTELLFNDMMPVRDSYKRMNKYIGFTMFCSWLKVLKYAKIFRSTQVLWDTLSAARYQLFAYSMVMLIMINAFAFLTVMLWGYSSKFFHNMPTAFFALVRLTAGEADMDYAELKRGDSSVTPFVFMGFIIFIAFIGMNMMIAIVTDYYEKARDKQQAWEADTQWIREQFSGKRQYEDFYRGKGLWNEPVYDTPMTGPIGQAWKSLRGHWLVKPIPVGCGPRKWNANEEKVEPKFETQRYPFVLHKSSLVLLRYGIESHEPNVRLHSVQDDEAKDHKYRSQHKPDEAARRETTDTLESFSRSKMSCTPLRSRDKSRIPEDTPDEQAQFGALKAWMSAENFSQYKGTSYLELLKGPTYKGEEVDAMDRSKLEKVVKELSVVDLKSLKRLDTDQLKDRLRDHLAVLRGADRPSCCGSFAKAVLTSCCCWWLRSSCACCRCGGDGGDELSLVTTEDGLRGKIVLEFQKLLRVRRASNSDRAAIIQRIQEKRQEYHAALEEECKEGHCYRHSAVADGDGLQHGGEGCRKCAIVNACHERVQECEHDLQRLHEQRGELEGVERIMVFRVKKVDAWQKFRPPDVRADEVAGNVGRLLKDKAMDGNITKEEVIQVLTEVVANVRQHEWDDETTTRAKLQDQPLSSLDERVHELKLDDDKKRRLVKIVLETEAARQHHKIATQTGQLLDRLNAMTTEQLMAYAESLQYFIDEHRLLVDVLLAEEMAQPDHKSKLRKEWLDTDVIEEDGKPVKRRVLIEKEVEQVMQQMANDEADKRQERDRDSSPAANCRSRSRHPAPIEDVMTRLLDKSNKGCKHEDLLEGDHDLASVMRRLLKKAQRVSSATAHAPQLEVAESSEFKLRVPFCLQTQIVMRALCDRLRPSWERCCNMLYWLWPLGFITRHFYFQESIESHVDGFLRHKCVHIRAGMPRGQSLKLQMAEFMSPAHSVPLSDFLYQLEYYVFKLKTPRLQGEDPTGLCDIIATLHFAHLAPWARYKLHRWLRKWSFIRVNWPTDALRLNWRDAFTKEDEEKAMSYLLGRYSDFVDRRGGSVWQDGCEHYRSNGVLLESHVAALLKEEREKAELPTSVGQEEDP